MTRAATSLTIVGPQKSVYGRDAGLSSFVTEAGLAPGQNVPGKNDPTPETPPASTVLARFFAVSDDGWMEEEDFVSLSYERREQ